MLPVKKSRENANQGWLFPTLVSLVKKDKVFFFSLCENPNLLDKNLHFNTQIKQSIFFCKTHHLTSVSLCRRPWSQDNSNWIFMPGTSDTKKQNCPAEKGEKRSTSFPRREKVSGKMRGDKVFLFLSSEKETNVKIWLTKEVGQKWDAPCWEEIIE